MKFSTTHVYHVALCGRNYVNGYGEIKIAGMLAYTEEPFVIL